MKQTIIRTLTALPGAREILRRYGARRVDTFVVSYPRSGRTWLRLLVGRALQRRYQIRVDDPSALLDPRQLARERRDMPTLDFTHDGSELRRRLRGKAGPTADKRLYAHAGVVLLARDPRDVVVSAYFHLKSRADASDEEVARIPQTLSSFVRDPEFGIESVVGFLNTWAANRDAPRRFMLARYERLLADPAAGLRELLTFAGVSDVSEDVIRDAVEFAGFENMRKLESTKALDSPHLRPTAPSSEESFWVRRGKAGGYDEYLTDDDREYADRVVSERLDPMFGYRA